MGMIRLRVSSSGALRETVRLARASRPQAGDERGHPAVETVSRREEKFGPRGR